MRTLICFAFVFTAVYGAGFPYRPQVGGGNVGPGPGWGADPGNMGGDPGAAGWNGPNVFQDPGLQGGVAPANPAGGSGTTVDIATVITALIDAVAQSKQTGPDPGSDMLTGGAGGAPGGGQPGGPGWQDPAGMAAMAGMGGADPGWQDPGNMGAAGLGGMGPGGPEMEVAVLPLMGGGGAGGGGPDMGMGPGGALGGPNWQEGPMDPFEGAADPQGPNVCIVLPSTICNTFLNVT